MLKLHKIFIALIISTTIIQAQNTPSSQQALQHFKNKEYQQALWHYSHLFNQSQRDIALNYYYGATLVETNTDVSQAAKCLRYAAMRNYNKDVLYYLGRASQLNYEFEEALIQFNKYIKLTGIDANLKSKSLQFIGECNAGVSMISKIYSPVVLKSDTIEAGQELDYYNLSKDAGKLMRNKDFFESGIEPNDIMFATERGDVVFYTIKTNNQSDIYKMERLIDGWSEGVLLGGTINSPSDELYPALALDGITIYFSSNRPGGLGGMDIYKATYDSGTKQFNNVANMGIPFNSPGDDYMLAIDEFKKQAWFASKRAVSGTRSVVHTIVWDDNLIKNNTTDINNVKVAAALAVSQTNNPLLDTKGSNNKQQASLYDNALFRFQIADTLEYTQFEQFKSVYALQAFKKGFGQEKLRDSLALQMSKKRKLYASATSETERNKHVNDILLLEKQTYSIGDGIENNYYEARKLEQDKIRELIRLGKYTSTGDAKVESTSGSGLKGMNIPTNLTIYSDDDFGRELLALKSVYLKFFHPDEAARLLQADSLYVWANVLNIESARLLEKAFKPAEPELVMPKPFNNKNAEAEVDPAQVMIKESKELRFNSLKLYHQAFDTKYEIYESKFMSLRNFSLIEAQYKEALNYSGEAYTYYKSATDLTENSLGGISPEVYEKSGTMKRKAVETQEKGLHYLASIIDIDLLTNKETGTAEADTLEKVLTLEVIEEEAPAVVEPTKQEIAPTKQNTESKEQATNTTSLEYRIQIGVYRNAIEASKLEKLPVVTTEKLDDAGLTKYFTGKYSTYNEAVLHLDEVKANGFPGAFIVSYLNKKQIPIIKARELEQKN